MPFMCRLHVRDTLFFSTGYTLLGERSIHKIKQICLTRLLENFSHRGIELFVPRQTWVSGKFWLNILKSRKHFWWVLKCCFWVIITSQRVSIFSFCWRVSESRICCFVFSFRRCLHEKTRTGASFIPGWRFYFVSRTDWVISYLVIWRYVHFNMLIKYTCDSKIKITNVTHGLPVPVYWQTDSTPNQVVVLRLHDTGVRFHTGVKLSPPVQQPGWTHAGVSRAGMTFRGVIM